MGRFMQQMPQPCFLMRTCAMPETLYDAVSRPTEVPVAGPRRGRIPQARAQLPRERKIVGV
jgi:hypothetical protein